jgi:hypothetical protein
MSAEEDCDDLLVGAGFAEVCLQVVAQLNIKGAASVVSFLVLRGKFAALDTVAGADKTAVWWPTEWP